MFTTTDHRVERQPAKADFNTMREGEGAATERDEASINFDVDHGVSEGEERVFNEFGEGPGVSALSGGTTDKIGTPSGIAEVEGKRFPFINPPHQFQRGERSIWSSVDGDSKIREDDEVESTSSSETRRSRGSSRSRSSLAEIEGGIAQILSAYSSLQGEMTKMWGFMQEMRERVDEVKPKKTREREESTSSEEAKEEVKVRGKRVQRGKRRRRRER